MLEVYLVNAGFNLLYSCKCSVGLDGLSSSHFDFGELFECFTQQNNKNSQLLDDFSSDNQFGISPIR